MADKPWKDESVLREKYIEQGLSMADIANELGCSNGKVTYWIDKYDINTRSIAEANSDGEIMKLRDEEYLRQAYNEEGKSTHDIAEELGVSESSVCEWMDRNGIERRVSNKEKSEVVEHKLHSKEWLQEKYHNEGLTLSEMAEECNTYAQTVRYWMQKHEIQTDSKSESFTDGNIEKLQDKDWLKEEYQDNYNSQSDIAQKLGLSQSVVWQYLHKHGIEIRKRAEYRTDGDLEKLHDQEYLKEEYWGKKKSSPEIADQLGVADTTVRKALHRYDIEMRHGTPSGSEHWNSTPELPCGDKYYGPNWTEQRRRARVRDQARCQRCGMTEKEHYVKYNQAIHVHHIIHRKEFIDENGILDYERANSLSNLKSYCFKCHKKVDPQL